MEPVKRRFTMQKKSSAMGGASTRPVSTAWPAGRLWTAPRWQLMSQRSTVRSAMGAGMAPRGSGLDKALAASARTLASILACSSKNLQSQLEQLPQATLPSSLRSLENQRSAHDVGSQYTLLRRSWEVASPGTRPASAVLSVGRALSLQMSPTRMGSFIAKFAMPKILAPQALGLEGLHSKWKRRSEAACFLASPARQQQCRVTPQM